jgi:hypothetical protein
MDKEMSYNDSFYENIEIVDTNWVAEKLVTGHHEYIIKIIEKDREGKANKESKIYRR